jgi:pilus assembly protein FimV
MSRSRVLLSATLLTLYSAAAFGLGMGKLELNSGLNQVFSAEIQLINIGRLQPEEIIPSLATQDDFNRYGVERTYILTDLDFVVRGKEDSSGYYYLEVTSDKPIREPFLNFIVEVLWPSGKILSEFTVLLDPPVFGEQGIAPIDSAETEASMTSGAKSSSRTKVTKTAPRAAPMSEGDVVDDEYGVTGPGDTLWTIALKVRPNASVSVQQTMLALQRLNPEAFINNNINLLKAGHVLRIPDTGDIREDTTQEAVAEVRTQNQEFKDYKSSGIAQMDTTRRDRQDTSSDAGDEDGELKLLAANRTSGQRAGDSDARTADIENELAITREDLDRARRANSELNVRLDDLAGQIETLSEIVKLKDDQLAAWRAELQKVQDAPNVAPSTPAETAQPGPVAKPQGSLLTNPFVIGGLLLLVIGALVAGMLVMRKRKDNTTDDDFTEITLAEPTTPSDDEEESGEGADEAAADENEEEEDISQQTSDPISEAEIYIAYGRFPQAIEFLQNAIEKDPQRADIQLKLLEVYVATEDSAQFNLLFGQLQALNDAEATAAGTELQEKLPGAAETAAAAMDATIVSSEPIEAIVEEDDDDDLSFDLDDLDAETEDDDLDLGDDLDLEDDSEDVPMSVNDEELDLDLGNTELDIDLDADLDADDTVLLEEGDLDLDLDIDLESDDLDDTVSLEEGDLDLGDLETSDGDSDELDLGDDDLDLGELDLGDAELDIDLDDDDAITLDIDDDFDLDDALSHEAKETLDLDDDDDAISIDFDEGDDINLDDELNLEAEAEPVDDDDAISLDLDADDDLGDLDLGEDDLGDLDLSADDDLGDLNLDDDDGLDLDDEDLGELNLDEDASSKLDLARAYIDMGDNDGARTLLNEVTSEGDEAQIKEANDLLGSLE